MLKLIKIVLIAACTVGFDASQARATAAETAKQGSSLAFSMYFGGSGFDSIRDIATDSLGNIFITGGTTSRDFPVTEAAYGPMDTSKRHILGSQSQMDVFVAKLSSDGYIIWSTVIGGPSYDRAYALQVDAAGYVYIAGRAGEGFPVTRGAFQTAFPGGSPSGPYPSQSGFVAKLTPDGKTLVFASYFGAHDDPSHPVRGLALDPNGDILIAASSATSRYPPAIASALRKGFQGTRAGRADGVIAKIKSDGSAVIWATYLGGTGTEYGEPSIRVNAAGQAYFLTVTDSHDAPTTEGSYDRRYHGNRDFYVAKLSADGRNLIFGTYLGGSGREITETHNLAIDKEGNAYVAAATTSADFPVTQGAFRTRYRATGHRSAQADMRHSVIAKLSSDGSRLLRSTFVGGQLWEAEGVAVDAEGNVFFAGSTISDDFPTTRDAYQHKRAGRLNGFAAKLSADFDQLIYATYLGGSASDSMRTAAIDLSGKSFYVAGQVTSKDWPVRNSERRAYSGEVDGGIAKLTLGKP